MNDYNGLGQGILQDDKKTLAERANEVGSKGMNKAGDALDKAATYFDDRNQGKSVVGDKLHTASQYMRDSDPRALASAIDSAISNHPYRALAIAAGAGWLMGRILKR